MIDGRFAERFESWLKLIQPHHAVRGSTGTGRITAENPRSGFVGDPEAGLFYHPSIVEGVTRDDDLYATETFGPIVGVARFGDVRRGDRSSPTGTATDCPPPSTRPIRCTRCGSASGSRPGMVSVNNSTSGAEAHLPFGGNGKSGNGWRQSGVWCSISSRGGRR
jgi:aldehyde dehydrogenase (NAD+)